MAGRGRRVTFHGSFGSKAAAKKKERAVHGFIERKRVKGQGIRYIVMKDKGR